MPNNCQVCLVPGAQPSILFFLSIFFATVGSQLVAISLYQRLALGRLMK